VTGLYGAPTDLDGNGRVLLYFTGAMNRLSPPASSTVVPARAHPRDLMNQTVCPGSNVGEIIYMLAADPTGQINSNVRTVSSIKGSAASFAGHELSHLVNDSRRLFVNGAPGFEEPWLDEALAGMADERMFYVATTNPTAIPASPRTGLTTGSNIVVSNLTTGPDASIRVAAFNTFENVLYGQFRPWLQNPARTGFVLSSVTAQEQRGAAAFFLRYAADRAAQENRPGGEAAFLSALLNSTTTGETSLNALLGADGRLWMRDFLMSLYMDDAGINAAAQYTTTSWNYRSLYIALNGSYQLQVLGLTPDVSASMTLAGGGTARYYLFDVPNGNRATITLTPPAVADPDAWYAVVRRQ
jgi:hypothetical protein